MIPKNPIKTQDLIISADNVELVHDPIMSQVFFDKAEMKVYRSESGHYQASFRLHFKNFNAQTIMKAIRTIYTENPEYPQDEKFRAINTFTQLYAPIPFPLSQDYVQSYSAYQYYVNGVWNSYYSYITLTEDYFAYSPTIVKGEESLIAEFHIMRATDTTDINDLIKAVRALGGGYMLVQTGLGLSHPSQAKAKFYTNSLDYFVEHPKFGEMPAGLYFVDLSEWKGEEKVWSKEDLSYTGK